MSYKNETLNDFTAELASKVSVPGGGGACAVCSALGAALASMVVNFTKGKKKFLQYDVDLARIISDAEKLSEQAILLADADAEAFYPLSKAYSLPAVTDDEIAKKNAIMEVALVNAASVPLSIMEVACRAITLHEELSHKCTKIMISDVGVGVTICKAALRGASLNVFVNTKLMADRDKAEAMNARANSMLSTFCDTADAVFEYVSGMLA